MQQSGSYFYTPTQNICKYAIDICQLITSISGVATIFVVVVLRENLIILSASIHLLF